MDMYFFGDIIYALGHNITKKICMSLGQQEEECKKFLPFDDVVKLVLEAEKAPDRVSIHFKTTLVRICHSRFRNLFFSFRVRCQKPKMFF